MTTTSTLLLCVLIGQTDAGSASNTILPAPQSVLAQSSARRGAEPAQVMPASRFGTPTPADARFQPEANSQLTTPQASDLMVANGNGQPTPNTQFGFQAPPANNGPANNGFQPVQPVASQQFASAPAPLTPAKQLIAQSFPTADDAGENTNQLALRDVIASTVDRTQRRAAIQTYWEASTLLADWQFANDEFELIRQVTAPRDSATQAVLSAAQAAAKARLIEAQMAANSAQFALTDAVPSAAHQDANPPMPIDPPFSGKYNTQFETLFAARLAPAGLRRIHETLPLRQDLVDARADAVIAATDAVNQQIDGYRAGRVSLADLLKEFENLRGQRGAFLGALRDYNLDIADYALGTSQPNDSPDKIVAMMINVPPGAANVVADAAPRNVIVSPAGATAPTTFAPSTGPTVIIQSNPPIGNAPNTFVAPPGTPVPNRIADRSAGQATALPRPATERTLGTLRDVTGQDQPQVLQPMSSFGTPPVSSQFGGGAQFGGGINDSSDGVQIMEPAENSPALPPLTP